MFKIFMQVLKYENKLVMEARSKGSKLIRPSTVLLLVLGLFYLTSGIDIIPEQFLQPKAFGFIDDIIVIAVIIILTGSDLGGVLKYASSKIPDIRIPEIRRNIKEVKVPTAVPGHKDIPDVVPNADSSLGSSDNIESIVGDSAIPDTVPLGDTPIDSENDEFDDPDFFESIREIIDGKPK